MDEFVPYDLFGTREPEEKKQEPVEAPVEEPCVETPEPCKCEEPVEAPVEEPVKEEPVEEPAPVEEPVAEEPAAEPEQEAGPDKLDLVLESQQQLMDRIDGLNKLFNSRIMYTAHEEKIVDQMHKELKKYKEDLYAQLVRPILMDIIEVRDSIMRISATYLAKPEGEQAVPNRVFADYAFDLQDILEKNDIEIYKSNPGDSYTPLAQRVLKKTPTADQALHGKVAESLSCGYRYGGKTISAEKVAVYIYEAPKNTNENTEENENG